MNADKPCGFVSVNRRSSAAISFLLTFSGSGWPRAAGFSSFYLDSKELTARHNVIERNGGLLRCRLRRGRHGTVTAAPRLDHVQHAGWHVRHRLIVVIGGGTGLHQGDVQPV